MHGGYSSVFNLEQAFGSDFCFFIFIISLKTLTSKSDKIQAPLPLFFCEPLKTEGILDFWKDFFRKKSVTNCQSNQILNQYIKTQKVWYSVFNHIFFDCSF